MTSYDSMPENTVNRQPGQIKATTSLAPRKEAALKEMKLTLLVPPAEGLDEKEVHLLVDYAFVRSLTAGDAKKALEYIEMDKRRSKDGIFRPSVCLTVFEDKEGNRLGPPVQLPWFTDDIQKSFLVAYYFDHKDQEERPNVNLGVDDEGSLANPNEAVYMVSGHQRNIYSADCAGLNCSNLNPKGKVDSIHAKHWATKFRSLESFLFKQYQIALRAKGMIFDGSRTETLCLLLQQCPELIVNKKFNLTKASDYLKEKGLKVPLMYMEDHGLLYKPSYDPRVLFSLGNYTGNHAERERFFEFPIMPAAVRLSLLQKMEEYNCSGSNISQEFLQQKLQSAGKKKSGKAKEYPHAYFVRGKYGFYYNRYSVSMSENDIKLLENKSKQGHQKQYFQGFSNFVQNECLMVGPEIYKHSAIICDKVSDMKREGLNKPSFSYYMFASLHGNSPLVSEVGDKLASSIPEKMNEIFHADGLKLEFLPYYKERCGIRLEMSSNNESEKMELLKKGSCLMHFFNHHSYLLRKPPSIEHMRINPNGEKDNRMNPKKYYLEFPLACSPQVFNEALASFEAKPAALELWDQEVRAHGWLGEFQQDEKEEKITYVLPKILRKGVPFAEFLIIKSLWVSSQHPFPEKVIEFDSKKETWSMQLPPGVSLDVFQNHFKNQTEIIKSIPKQLDAYANDYKAWSDFGGQKQLSIDTVPQNVVAFCHYKDEKGTQKILATETKFLVGGYLTPYDAWFDLQHGPYNLLSRCGFKVERIDQKMPSSIALLRAEAALRHCVEKAGWSVDALAKLSKSRGGFLIKVDSHENFDNKMNPPLRQDMMRLYLTHTSPVEIDMGSGLTENELNSLLLFPDGIKPRFIEQKEIIGGEAVPDNQNIVRYFLYMQPPLTPEVESVDGIFVKFSSSSSSSSQEAAKKQLQALKTANKELEAAKQQLEELDAEKQQLQEQIKQLQEQIKQLQAEKQQLQEQIKQLQEQIKQLQTANKQLQPQIKQYLPNTAKTHSFWRHPVNHPWSMTVLGAGSGVGIGYALNAYLNVTLDFALMASISLALLLVALIYIYAQSQLSNAKPLAR